MKLFLKNPSKPKRLIVELQAKFSGQRDSSAAVGAEDPGP